ncbi:D-alanyl-D-alanine carboxypeptidase/D-alanyl-D-alanine endopeptidase [Actinomadura logoneensis]|uniref:D-alanyl-D-alanine carboxypeptidase/D-alanyl-D-alanine endopeptidase n=1 Tax=Actinomadura logoneensis TaxID=2293572 RepID=UPI001F35B060|nr:D-alanyl-D-alanine carboxypeptidase/D-alanyl-D-alanine-endopeptidase [Actinomadura logoneensis]
MASHDPVPTSAGLAAPDPAAARAPDPSALAARLSAVLNQPGPRISAAVIDAATRQPLFAQRADQAATPASTTKLATSVAALAAVGPQHRITTRAVRGGDGAVVLVGGGDPTLTAAPQRPGTGRPTYASLVDLAKQTSGALTRAGVRQVRVDYDASAYQGPRTAPGWKRNYLPDGEVAPLTALTVDEGRIGGPGAHAQPRVQDPPAAAAQTFARLLKRFGVLAKAGRRTTAPADAQPLGAVQSPPISALIEHAMTESDNDVAEAMARQVAIKKGLPASFGGGAQAVRETLAGLGIADGVSVSDGSGLSTRNRITPLALARMAALAASPQRPDLRAAITGMPVAGFTGTLGPPRYTTPGSLGGAGMIRAKTGTLSGVNTLAGLAVDADGRLLAFAFMAGDGKTSVDPGKLDQLAAVLAGCGC